MADFVKWKPERFGHKPPHWREGMDWGISPALPKAQPNVPMWFTDMVYIVPREAVHGIETIVSQLRQYPAEELAKHGITLAPEKDWATELWADALEARGFVGSASFVRNGKDKEYNKAPIELLRSRVTPKDTGA